MASRISALMRRACRHPARSPAAALLGTASMHGSTSSDLTTTCLVPGTEAPFPFRAKAAISAQPPRLARGFA